MIGCSVESRARSRPLLVLLSDRAFVVAPAVAPSFTMQPLRPWARLLQPCVPRESSAVATACGQPPQSAHRARQARAPPSPASLSAPALFPKRDGSRLPIDHDVGRCPWRSQVLHLWPSRSLGRSIRHASSQAQRPINVETVGRRPESHVFARSLAGSAGTANFQPNSPIK